MPDEPKRRDGAGLGEVVRELLGSGVWRRGVALGRLSRSWEQVVGEKLASVCRPVSLEDGKLLVGASSAPWAAQLGFLSGELVKRANALLEKSEVTSVRVIVERSGGPRGRSSG